MHILLLVILISLLFRFLGAYVSADIRNRRNANIPKIEETEDPNNFKGRYQVKYLLTKNEWYEYKKLKEIAENKGLQVCPKVRLLDILELDDNSHNQTERKKRDEFVDQILKDVGYTVIRTRSITEDTLNQIH